MANIKTETLCPLPWIHFSSHLDSTMRICCNTDHSGFIYDNNGKTIKLAEVENISDYFNVDSYKEIRSQMLQGKKPKICTKCFEIEDAGGSSVRESYLSQYKRDKEFINKLKETREDGFIVPEVKSLDLSLSNNCNLKCIMCNPAASLPIKNDFEKLGLEYDKEFTRGASENWKNSKPLENIIPQIGKSLEQYLTTGGEPFLNKTHLKTLEILTDSGDSKHIVLQYHTNCTIRNDKLFEIWKSFKKVSVHFSIDSVTELDEYIRYKTDWATVNSNVELMLEHKKVHAEVHCCVQALNVFNLIDLYEWIKTLNNKIPLLPYHIWMDQPSWLHINILPKDLKIKAYNKLENYFLKNEHLADSTYRERSKQILSYLQRSINEPHDIDNMELFQSKIRLFEKLRGLKKIEDIVPEFNAIMSKKKKWYSIIERGYGLLASIKANSK